MTSENNRRTNMTKINVVIADDSAELCNSIKEFFREDEQVQVVATAGDGVDALDKVQRYQPDVLILDIIMPGLDGYEVLGRIKKLTIARKPKVIVISQLCSDTFITKALSGGAVYFMAKPVNNDILRERIIEFGTGSKAGAAKQNTSYNSRQKSLDEKLANIFITVGIPAHIKGYQFLREAIKMAIDNPDIINSITKKLYPGIADKFNTSASKVERAIRHAIEVAWNRGKIENINSIFGIKIYSPNDKPTNGEFIALLADKMIMEGA